MGFMRHIKALNQHDPSCFIPFLIQGKPMGKVRPDFAALLNRWPDVFNATATSLELVVKTTDTIKRSDAVAAVIQQLVDEKAICELHGELYPVAGGNRNAPLLLLDRAIAPYFGVRTYGQHINGFVRTDAGLKLWIGRRAEDRRNFPGCLDNFVAGGLPHGLKLMDNIIKECMEEASLPAPIARLATPAGAVCYNVDTTKGFNPFTLYCYDLELPADFQPRCTDGEVEGFYLWSVEKVMDIVRNTEEFKPNCNLVIIDFLIRHGYIGPEKSDYLELLSGLHPESRK